MSEAPEPGRPLRFCRFAAVAVGGLLLAAGALARDGALVESVPIRVDAKMLRAFGPNAEAARERARDVEVSSLTYLLEKHPRADASRLGMLGVSRGGMMTYLALARTDRIAAAVVVGGISDLVDKGRRRYEMETVYAELIPGYPEEGTGALEERSVIRWVERLPRATALLLQHGAADENVHPGQVLVLAGRLVETGHTVRLVLFEGGDHGLTGHTEDAVRARGPKTPAR